MNALISVPFWYLLADKVSIQHQSTIHATLVTIIGLTGLGQSVTELPVIGVNGYWHYKISRIAVKVARASEAGSSDRD